MKFSFYGLCLFKCRQYQMALLLKGFVFELQFFSNLSSLKFFIISNGFTFPLLFNFCLQIFAQLVTLSVMSLLIKPLFLRFPFTNHQIPKAFNKKLLIRALKQICHLLLHKTPYVFFLKTHHIHLSLYPHLGIDLFIHASLFLK